MKPVFALLGGVVLISCAGSKPSSATPPAPAETAAPVASSAGPETASPAPTVSAEPSAPSAGAAATTTKLEVSGTINGKTFAPKVGWVFSRMQDGYATINFMEKEPCSMMEDGDVGLGVFMPWQEGASVDLSTQRDVAFGKQKVKLAAAAFVQNKTTKVVDKKTGIAGARTENSPVPGFKPKGKATLIAAPNARDSVGRLEIDLSSGDFKMKGSVDVKVCAELKQAP
jgi:hypothetical protein